MGQEPMGERVARLETRLDEIDGKLDGFIAGSELHRKEVMAELKSLNGTEAKLASHGLHADAAPRNRIVMAVGRGLVNWTSASIAATATGFWWFFK